MLPRVIVCGGRSYFNKLHVWKVLDEVLRIHGPFILIEGGAAGADTSARLWAQDRKVDSETHHANWAKHGKSAGSIRNSEMLDSGCDLVIAFPGGRGTVDMVSKAKQRNIEVILAVPITKEN